MKWRPNLVFPDSDLYYIQNMAFICRSHSNLRVQRFRCGIYHSIVLLFLGSLPAFASSPSQSQTAQNSAHQHLIRSCPYLASAGSTYSPEKIASRLTDTQFWTCFKTLAAREDLKTPARELLVKSLSHFQIQDNYKRLEKFVFPYFKPSLQPITPPEMMTFFETYVRHVSSDSSSVVSTCEYFRGIGAYDALLTAMTRMWQIIDQEKVQYGLEDYLKIADCYSEAAHSGARTLDPTFQVKFNRLSGAAKDPLSSAMVQYIFFKHLYTQKKYSEAVPHLEAAYRIAAKENLYRYLPDIFAYYLEVQTRRGKVAEVSSVITGLEKVLKQLGLHDTRVGVYFRIHKARLALWQRKPDVVLAQIDPVLKHLLAQDRIQLHRSHIKNICELVALYAHIRRPERIQELTDLIQHLSQKADNRDDILRQFSYWKQIAQGIPPTNSELKKISSHLITKYGPFHHLTLYLRSK